MRRDKAGGVKSAGRENIGVSELGGVEEYALGYL